MNRPLNGRTALVTGGTRGIGAAIAIRLLEDGANVTVTGTSTEGQAPEGCAYIAINFLDQDATEAFSAEAAEMGIPRRQRQIVRSRRADTGSQPMGR